ncbi:DUF3231 family protein [Aquibacillus koreensis]|uniref:DUF3231 family protein n=1 Tax=Aquibacillus koreensis TaxID=279446 RepID=A0A9X3WLZ9_9BACI|nr:DUF3231 family protein [Aquibacillus koreensis]MCT2535209.1 DUF3231 family protein [Aquibacillus koreensis]MDC3421068.1 DUF3231 family protein [Aquibacillus koreensis]
MTNVFESVKDFLQMNLDNEPKNPMHVGEVMTCWMYLALMDEATIYIQIGLNTSNDDEVKRILKESLHQCETQSQRFKDLMKKEGIPQPPTSEERPKSDPNAIPIGAKLTDEEIMNGLSIKTLTAVTHCATAASQSIRTDIAAAFAHCLLEKMKFGSTLREQMRKRGWIKVPPYYYPPGAPKS